MASSELDAFFFADGAGLTTEIELLITEAWRHLKFIAASGDSCTMMEKYGITADDPGVYCKDDLETALSQLQEGLSEHRAWARVEA